MLSIIDFDAPSDFAIILSHTVAATSTIRAIASLAAGLRVNAEVGETVTK